jgi:capsular polysaccharide transport system permease protein
VSESSFVVRTQSQQSQSSGLVGQLLQSSGLSNSQNDAYAVNDYIASRDALSALNKNETFVKAYSGRNGDLFSRFNPLGFYGSGEQLLLYYQKQVDVQFDTTTSIATLKVSAFNPQDAHRFNRQLLVLSEQLVNRMNERAQRDMVDYAVDEVSQAESRVKAAAAALSAFRNKQSIFDPDKQSALQLQQVGELRSELVTSKTQLAELRSLAPNNPQVKALETRIGALQTEINNAVSGVAGASGSLANKAPAYQRLALERDFADQQLSAALVSLESARADARKQQLYLERISQPSLPDEALLPRRARNVLITFILGLVLWGTLSLLISSVREHRD